MCIGSCSVRRRSRGTILLLDCLLTEQDPIHRLYIWLPSHWLIYSCLKLSCCWPICCIGEVNLSNGSILIWTIKSYLLSLVPGNFYLFPVLQLQKCREKTQSRAIKSLCITDHSFMHSIKLNSFYQSNNLANS